MRSPKFLMFSFSIIMSLFLLSCAPVGEDDLPPEPKAPGADGGLVGQAYTAGLAAAGYADPTGFFSISPDPLLNIWTEESTGLLSSRVENDQLIYRYGYYTDASGRWVQLEFAGTRVGTSNWLRAPATKELTLGLTAAAGVNRVAMGENFIAAYACSKVGRTWNCHNGKWMAHSYTLQLTPCYSDSDCAGAGEGYFCDGGAGTTAGTCQALPEGPVGPSEFAVEYCIPKVSGSGVQDNKVCKGEPLLYSFLCSGLTSDCVDGIGDVPPPSQCDGQFKIDYNITNDSDNPLRGLKTDCSEAPVKGLLEDFNLESSTCMVVETSNVAPTRKAACAQCNTVKCRYTSGSSFTDEFISAASCTGPSRTNLGPVSGPGCDVTSVCEDTDGGNNKLVKGSITGTLSTGQTASYTDYCYSSSKNRGREYFCSPTGFLTRQDVECSATENCLNGACIAPASCADSDGTSPSSPTSAGTDKRTKGTVTLFGSSGETLGSFDDSCTTGSPGFYEGYCSSNTYNSAYYTCPSGTTCSDGACR